jgi:hypothetical protein
MAGHVLPMAFVDQVAAPAEAVVAPLVFVAIESRPKYDLLGWLFAAR